MGGFVSGLELSRRFFEESVRPVLETGFPGLPYGAALLGRGSEVLGYDDELSTDHDWEARVLLYLHEADQARVGARVEDALRRSLPSKFLDRPVDFELHTVRGYFLAQLALDLDQPIEARDWLTLPEHRLRMVTVGATFHDQVGLGSARARLAHYPHDVWLYLLMVGWWRIHPEANLVGRAGSVGDELGSSLIGSRLVSDVMRLCFLMEREYAPYSKWLGTAFARLPCGPELTPILWRVVQAPTWQVREEALLAAYEKLASLHNELGLTAPQAVEIEQMWGRPFRVAWADFPGLLRGLIQDPAVVRIAEKWPIGPVDQFRELVWSPSDRHVLLPLFDT